jgi:hypothetical protein
MPTTGFKNQLASGTLLTLDNQIDQDTHTAKLKATFPNEDDALFPNQFVNTGCYSIRRQRRLHSRERSAMRTE